MISYYKKNNTWYYNLESISYYYSIQHLIKLMYHNLSLKSQTIWERLWNHICNSIYYTLKYVLSNDPILIYKFIIIYIYIYIYIYI